MNKNKKILISVLVAIVVVALVGAWYYNKNREQKNAGEISGTTPIATETSSSSLPADGGRAGLVSDVTATSLSYGQAVTIFANERIQFDQNCRMLPTRIVVKNGTTLMFDNRSRDARTFKLDGTRYTLAGYGFKLFQLNASKLPHIVNVDCGTGQNNGTIELE